MVMETRHLQQLRKRFGAAIGRDQCHILDIPDEYGFMDSELIELLRQSVEPILNKITYT